MIVLFFEKDISPDNEKYFVSLSQRLKETSGEQIIYKKIIKKEDLEGRIDPLKPKLVIHSRKVEKKIEFPEVKIEEEKKIDYRDEEIFEIEKVKAKGPEFIEVKPKVIAKEEISEKKQIKEEDEIIGSTFEKSFFLKCLSMFRKISSPSPLTTTSKLVFSKISSAIGVACGPPITHNFLCL